ncbi:MAG: peptidoglycan bridge formation glycyltransferase FemA/FemB family protein [bacterium]
MSKSFLHSSAWERFQETAGSRPFRHDGQLYLYRSIPKSHYYISSRCQIGADFALPEELKKGWFLRFEPEDEVSLKNLRAFAAKQNLKLIPTLAVQPRQTMVLDLTKSYDDILAGMRQKHRYNVRLAEKHEVKVDIVSHDLVKAFDRFWKLLSGTAERQDFRTHHREYYEQLLAALEPENEAHLLFAHKDGQDLAAMLLITYAGTATYLHGGSSDQNRQLMAPFVLHSEAIKFAQSQGNTAYDFWGTDLEKNPETGEWQVKEGHASVGTSRFKLGFGGTVIDYPGAYDLILNPICYTLYKTVRKLRGGKRAFA